MRLTVEENRETIKRYAHLKRARGWQAKSCSAKCPGSPRTCSRETDHRGPHAAHGSFGKVLAVWESGSDSGRAGQQVVRAPDAKQPSTPRGRRPVGLRSKSPTGFIEGLRALVTRFGASAEEIAFVIFFLAFVAFAIGGFLLIYLG